MNETVQNGWKVTFVVNLDGRRATTKVWLNRMAPVGPITESILRDVAGQMAGNFQQHLFGPFSSNEAVLEAAHIVDLDPADGTGIATSADTNIGGTGNAGQSAALAASVLVTLHGQQRGRSWQNRMFVPFVGEELLDHGRIYPTANVTAVQEQAEQFRETSESTVQGWQIAIMRRKNPPAGRTGQIFPCESISTTSRVAYQLRRSR